MKNGIIIQARMNSTRVPGKVSLDFGGKPLLWHVVSGLKKVKNADTIIVATGPAGQNAWIKDFCMKYKTNFFSYDGDENDVLSRFFYAASEHKLDNIVRVCADNIFIPYNEISYMIKKHIENKSDYTTNFRHFCSDLSVEIVTLNALARAYHKAKTPYDREHVTPFFYKTNPKNFTLSFLAPRLKWPNRFPPLCIDNQQDIQSVLLIVKRLFSGKKPVSENKLRTFLLDYEKSLYQ